MVHLSYATIKSGWKRSGVNTPAYKEVFFMRAIMESAFSVIYLFVAIMFGILILKKAGKRKEHILFGVMTLVLGCGDAFHLVPRVISLNAADAAQFTATLGFGTLVTSITMTVFYVMFYHVWQLRYKIKSAACTVSVYTLAVIRIGLCMVPQNNWLSADAPWAWGVYRNIPFVILGVLMIALFSYGPKKHNDILFRFMWLAIALSFMFYIPVVLFVDRNPLFGLFMLPKTVMYVWMIWMGYKSAAQ
jgi:hypothetical protein